MWNNWRPVLVLVSVGRGKSTDSVRWISKHYFTGSRKNQRGETSTMHYILYYYTSDSLWKPDWSRAFNQFTIACELDMINAISAVDIAFIMSSSKSAWLLSPLECSPQKQNGWTLRFCFWGWIMWKMYNNYWIRFSHDIMNYQNLVSVLSAEAEGLGR